MKKKLLFLPFVFVVMALISPDETLQSLLDRIDKFNFENPQEKAYLHTDKGYYMAGETLWFKATLVEGQSHLRDTVSIPLYVDLIDLQKQKILDSRTIKLEGGFGHGDFDLPDSLFAGTYRVRAYTSWMKNFAGTDLFQKDFHVFERNDLTPEVTKPAQDVEFGFFPEGGHLVEGLQSRIAFKAVNKLGKGVFVSGAIIDNHEDTVTVFESQHLGMGTFNFTPLKGQKYKALIFVNKVARKTVPFPVYKDKGYVITTDNFSNAQQIRVFISRNTVQAAEDLMLLGMVQGKVYYSARMTVKKDISSVQIPRNLFPPGVVTLTLFDVKANPLCERLIYQHLNATPEVKFKTDKTVYSSREKTVVEVAVTDPGGKPAEGEFSVSVLDKGQIKDQDNVRHIRSYLMLESEVKGYIENPAAYFNKQDPKAPVFLDLLLMTQGWRRFSWDEILKPSERNYRYLIERGLSVTGEITRVNGKNFEKPVNITMMITRQDSTVGMSLAESAPDGSFGFYGHDFRDSVKVYLQAIVGKNSRNSTIVVSSPNLNEIDLIRFPYRAISFEAHDLAAYLKLSNELLQLQRKLKQDRIINLDEFVVKAKKQDQLRDGRVLYSQADASIKVTDNMYGFNNVLDLIRGRVAGVQVTGDAFNPSVLIRGISSLSGSNEPTFLLDGIVVDKSMVLSIPVPDVEAIDVLKGPSSAIYGSRGGNGVISVLTKRGNPNYDWKNDPSPGVKIFQMKGYSTPKTFYVPQYDSEVAGNERPDYRSTVYWNPVVRTDNSGKARFEFFNTDNTGTFEIFMEGLTFSGLPVASRKVYEVRMR